MVNAPLLVERRDRFGAGPLTVGGVHDLDRDGVVHRLQGETDEFASLAAFRDPFVSAVLMPRGHGPARPLVWCEEWGRTTWVCERHNCHAGIAFGRWVRVMALEDRSRTKLVGVLLARGDIGDRPWRHASKS